MVGGIHGGNRIGGNAVADIIIFGTLAGHQAAMRSKSSKTPVLYAGYAQRYPAFSAARCLPGLHLRTHAMPDDHRVYSYSAVLMGSPILLKLFSHDEALASRVFRLIKQYEDLLTVNRAHSEVMDINHAAGQRPVSVSRPVFELIRCAKAASLLKDSAFNGDWPAGETVENRLSRRQRAARRRHRRLAGDYPS